MPDIEAATFGEVYYEPSDSVAIFEGSGVVRMNPVLIRRSTTADGNDSGSKCFVLLDGQYFLAEALPHFVRFEKVPSVRPRPKCVALPSYTEPYAPEVETKGVLERLAAEKRKWAQEGNRK